MKWLQDTGGNVAVNWREKDTMPVLIRNYSDDEAVIIMVDSNIQRENILPSEKGICL